MSSRSRKEAVLRALQERARRVREGELSGADLNGEGPGRDELFGVLLEQSLDGIVVNARESRWLIEVSDSFCDLTGYAREELLGRTSVELGLIEEDEARQMATRQADEGLPGLYEARLRRKDGKERWVEYSHQFLGEDFVLTIVRDATDRRRRENELRRLADSDPLTGLFNRRRFELELERELRAARRFKDPVSLLLVDIDGLKAINDHHGHQFGDRAVCAVADGLRHSTRGTDIIGRIGGDEFSVLVTRSGAEGAERIVRDLRKDLTKRRFAPSTEMAPVSVSIGIANTADGEQSYESLMRQADRAMYAEKARAADQPAS